MSKGKPLDGESRFSEPEWHERECGDDSGRAIHGHGGPRGDKVAMNIGEGDGPVQCERGHTARHAADLASLRVYCRAGRRNSGAFEHEPDEPARHAAVTAVQHTDDDFLTNVATLGQTDRSRLQSCL